MRFLNFLFTTAMLSTLYSFSLSALAADGAVLVTSIAQTETVTIDKQGKKTIKRHPVEKAVPGDEIIFTTTFENTIDKAVNDISINNPIPKDTEYKAGSAFGKDCEILFSVDGKTFGFAEDLKITGEDGKERTALPREYTHIRWTYKVPLPAGKAGDVGFRAIIK